MGNILRQELYFQMVATQRVQNKNQSMKDLKFEPIFKLNPSGHQCEIGETYKSSVDSELGLLGVEAPCRGEKLSIYDVNYLNGWFGIYDLNKKKKIFEQKFFLDGNGRHSHRWI